MFRVPARFRFKILEKLLKMRWLQTLII